MHLIPALLEKDPAIILSQINQLLPHFTTFQIDIADGIFVPNKTVQIDELYKVVFSIKYKEFKNLNFDFHLMVTNFEKDLIKLLRLKNLVNIKNVFIHYSLFPKYEILNTKYSPLVIGPVLNPEDSVNQLIKSYDLMGIEFIQIMSVNPGFQGAPFIPQTLNKIDQLRQNNYRNKIYLDGAINQDTIPLILSQKYKPDFLCIGSFLTKTEKLRERIDYLKEKVG